MSNEALFQLSVKAVVRNQAGQVLLLRATTDEVKHIEGIAAEYWDIPGGRLAVSEQPLETLRREVGEEVGLTHLINIEFLAAAVANVRVDLDNGQQAGIILFAYVCQYDENEPVTISREHESFAWHSPAEAAALLRANYPEAFIAKLTAL